MQLGLFLVYVNRALLQKQKLTQDGGGVEGREMPSCLLHTLNHTPHTHGALSQKETSLLIAAVSRLLMPLCSHTTGQQHSPRFRQAIHEGGSHQGAARIWCHRVGEEEYVGEEGEKEEGLGRGIECTRTNDAVYTLQRTATHRTT